MAAAGIPVRTCVGCRKAQPAGQLVRVTLGGDGRLVVGRTAPGRGAWLCDSPECLQQALKTKAFERALRGSLVEGGAGELRERIGSAGNGTAEGVRG